MRTSPFAKALAVLGVLAAAVGCGTAQEETVPEGSGSSFPTNTETASSFTTETASQVTSLTTNAVAEALGFDLPQSGQTSLTDGGTADCPTDEQSFNLCENRDGLVSVRFENCATYEETRGSFFDVFVDVSLMNCQIGSQTFDGAFSSQLKLGPIPSDELNLGRCHDIPVSGDVEMVEPLTILNPDGSVVFLMNGNFEGSFSCTSRELSVDFTQLIATLTEEGGATFTCQDGACTLDSDLDGIIDEKDNCPHYPNTNQIDRDSDGIGDLCEAPPVTASCNFDGACDEAEGESVRSCPLDCHCGDGICGKEDFSDCPQDCCGDGQCLLHFEDAAICAQDCFCGNETCDGDETASDCAADCFCGNALCDGGEDAATCFDDCHCGNGVCEAEVTFETIGACGQDCHCGNGICEPEPTFGGLGEDANNCPYDCAVCGDGICTESELGGKEGGGCSEDCANGVTAFCGNTYCDGEETAANCLGDCHCGNGIVEPDPGAYEQCEPGIDPDPCLSQGKVCRGGDCRCTSCGNGTCEIELEENYPFTSSYCPQDCEGVGYCGDGVCDDSLGETSVNCSDCSCGNGVCEPELGEYNYSCPDDCTCGNGTCEQDRGEDETNCIDCSCGNGTCDLDFPLYESAYSCITDCPAVCGNFACEPGETSASCPSDCFSEGGGK